MDDFITRSAAKTAVMMQGIQLGLSDEAILSITRMIDGLESAEPEAIEKIKDRICGLDKTFLHNQKIDRYGALHVSLPDVLNAIDECCGRSGDEEENANG